MRYETAERRFFCGKRIDFRFTILDFRFQPHKAHALFHFQFSIFNFQLIKHVSRDACQDNHEYRVHFKFEGGDEGDGEDDIAFVIDEVLFVHE